MRNYSKILIGILLIGAGILFLGKNYGWFSFNLSFYALAKWWPALLILAGVGVFLHPQRNLGNPLTVLAVVFAIPLALYAFTREGINRVEDRLSYNFEEDYSNNENDDRNYNEEKQYNEEGRGDRPTEQVYTVDNEDGIKSATLEFGGGAAEFHLEPSTTQLFYAKTSLNSGGYKLESETKSDGKKEIKFEMGNQKKDDFRFDSDNDFNNNVYLKMNPDVVWDVDMGIGAGDLDFDFSKFRIKDLEVKTGAASVKLRLSDLENRVNVKVESGVAKVRIELPKSIGCRVEVDGAMNSLEFSGLKKVNDSSYESPDFKSSTKQIYIDLESGLSSIEIVRY